VQVVAGSFAAVKRSVLFLAGATVKIHVGRMLGELHLRDRVQAVGCAYVHGLVRPKSRP
jgi:ATP/maltotriose-dependent transcriptional regulator MalT